MRGDAPEPWTADDVRRIVRDERNRAIVGEELWKKANDLLSLEETGLDEIENLAIGATQRAAEIAGVQYPATYWQALEHKWRMVNKSDLAVIRERLASAAVYFLHEDIINAVAASSTSLHSWEVQSSDFITPCGFVWLERPLQHPLGMQGFLWISNENEKLMITSLDVFGPRATLAAHLGDDVLDPEFVDREQETFRLGGFEEASIRELHFITAAILFMSQEILVRSEEHAPRHVARRLSREQRNDAGAESISVLVLRRQHSRSGEKADAGSPVDWAWRWAVRGHWRQQPVGEGRKQRRTVWVHPHVKGPDDRPFKPPPGQIFDVRR